MGKENLFGMMGIYIKANLKMIKQKEMVNLHSKTEKFTKVNLKKEITMVLENLYSIVEMFMRDIIKMDKKTEMGE